MKKNQITCNDFVEYLKKPRPFSIIFPSNLKENIISDKNIIRPLQLILEKIPISSANKIALFGLEEYLLLSKKTDADLSEINAALIVLTDEWKNNSLIKKLFIDKKIPVLKSKYSADKTITIIHNTLEKLLSKKISLHGVLLSVHDVGIFLRGESGIGKSECALSLISRGHKLITDDIVDIRLEEADKLVGYTPYLVKYHMEVRGIGIINVRQIFGITSVLDEHSIDMVIELQEWRKELDYDRLGLDENFEEILGIKIPKVCIPIKPGRNIDVLVETVGINYLLKKSGFNAAKDFYMKIKNWIEPRDE